MSDEELVARLRNYGHVGTVLEAADRIEQLVATNEALVKERDQWIEHTKNAVWADSEELKLANARAERLEAAASAVADDVCSYICPSVGRAGEPILHDPRCIALRAALKGADHE